MLLLIKVGTLDQEFYIPLLFDYSDGFITYPASHLGRDLGQSVKVVVTMQHLWILALKVWTDMVTYVINVKWVVVHIREYLLYIILQNLGPT